MQTCKHQHREIYDVKWQFEACGKSPLLLLVTRTMNVFPHSRRASELRITYSDRVAYDDSDTFEHILNVTLQNDALLAYYYLDSENKVIYVLYCHSSGCIIIPLLEAQIGLFVSPMRLLAHLLSFFYRCLNNSY